MIKRISLLTRKPGLSRAEFNDYWLNVHGPMVARLPNVIRYVQNHITDDAHRHDLPSGGQAVDGFVATQPIGFRCWPEYTHLHTVPDWTQRVHAPDEMAAYAREAVEIGINYIGSCCGSGPDQVRAMAEALGKPRRELRDA